MTLSKKYTLKRGFKGFIQGNLPAGGISFSASYVMQAYAGMDYGKYAQ